MILHLPALILRQLVLLRCWLENQVLAPYQYFGLFQPTGQPCPIDWRPHALAPVFYGFRDYGFATGAPGPCRVFFPSLDGSPTSAPILEGCGRFPLVVFVHGQCELDAEHYKKWFLLPATLARAGFVVAVPHIPHGYPPSNDVGLDRIRQTVDWMHQCWPHRDLLLPESATGIAGHSWGAMLAARYVADHDVAAYAAISGSWADFQNSLDPIENVGIPKFFCWGDGGEDVFSEITDAQWEAIAPTKHRAAFDSAAHWDYLPPGQSGCEAYRGSCSLTHVLTMDLVTMFFGRYLAWAGSPAPGGIPASLEPPDLNLTVDQEFFAGGYLQGFSSLESDEDCGMTLAWETASGSGTTDLP